MASDKSKPLAAIILAASKPKKDEADKEDTAEAKDGTDEGKLAAAEELLAAVKNDDAEALLEAFESLKELCSY